MPETGWEQKIAGSKWVVYFSVNTTALSHTIITHPNKFVIIISLIFFMHAVGQTSNDFEITGEVNNAEGKEIYVAPTAEAVAIDSSIVKNGKFTLKEK